MDGAITESQTSHQQVTTTHACNYAAPGPGELETPTVVLMHANSQVPVAIWNQGIGQFTPMVIPDGNVNINIGGWVTSEAAAATKANPIQLQAGLGNIDKWRTVSQGMRITLLNNDQENDGWFESVRLKISMNEEHYTLSEFETDKARLIPNLNMFAAAKDRNIADQPSYMAGPLKDIHKVQFDLHHITEDHPFTVVPSAIDVGYFSTATPPAGNAPNRLFTFDRGEIGANRLVKTVVDNNCDVIMLYIWGRKNVVSPSNLLIEVAQNSEIVYSEGSTLSKYHQKAQYSAAAKNAQKRASDLKKQDTQAATKRKTDANIVMDVE
jgi:hypothetical protein